MTSNFFFGGEGTTILNSQKMASIGQRTFCFGPFENNLLLWCPISPEVLGVFSRHTYTLLHSCYTSIKIRWLTWIYYYSLLRFLPQSASLFSNFMGNWASSEAFSYPVSSAFFSLPLFLSLHSTLPDLDTFENYRPVNL